MALLGLEWYWWLFIVAVLAISVPFKIQFMRWWDRHKKERKDSQYGKWGDDE